MTADARAHPEKKFNCPARGSASPSNGRSEFVDKSLRFEIDFNPGGYGFLPDTRQGYNFKRSAKLLHEHSNSVIWKCFRAARLGHFARKPL